jgi:uncharacterized protein (DUF433 family)
VNKAAVVAPRFTFADFERANQEWSANCGPGALAAILNLTLVEARPHFGPGWPGYTNPTAMRSALLSSGCRFTVLQRGFSGYPLPWPRYGLARIQWEGPWTQPGVPMRARYRYTHWVGTARRSPAVSIDPAVSFGRPVIRGTRVKVDVVADLAAAGEPTDRIALEFGVDEATVHGALAWHRGGGDVGIFDINVLENGTGWCSLQDWSMNLAPALAKGHDRRATGGWHITHAIEVEPAVPADKRRRGEWFDLDARTRLVADHGIGREY